MGFPLEEHILPAGGGQPEGGTGPAKAARTTCYGDGALGNLDIMRLANTVKHSWHRLQKRYIGVSDLTAKALR